MYHSFDTGSWTFENLPQVRQELDYSTFSQYHGSQFPDDTRSQGISSHDIDYVELK